MDAGQLMPNLPEHLVWLNVEKQDAQIRPGSDTYLLYFWSMECPACQMISSRLTKIQKDPSQVQVIYIHVPLFEEEKSIERVQAKITKLHLKAPVVLDHQYEVVKLFGVEGLPSVYLFDQDRRLIYFGMGEEAYHDAMQSLDHATTA